ncbi:hypothetical protein ABZ883_03010 [Streptomyces sp. NPDC046977]|uniref:hypothetical protein n=1 Tax=Streptomyces sp. NPDC046977 TaxID=3154703 RepID=UPI0033E78EEF
MTQEQINAWVDRQMAAAPVRDDAWRRRMTDIIADGLARSRKAAEDHEGKDSTAPED